MRPFDLVALCVSDRQRANLETLAAYHERGGGEERFDMKRFFEVRGPGFDLEVPPGEVGLEHNDCGTVCCALGGGPLAGISAFCGETWSTYCFRAFGIYTGGPAWQFMFGGEWAERDNTRAGAAARIRYAIEIGVPEAGHTRRMMLYGYDLCYEEVS